MANKNQSLKDVSLGELVNRWKKDKDNKEILGAIRSACEAAGGYAVLQNVDEVEDLQMRVELSQKLQGRTIPGADKIVSSKASAQSPEIILEG